MKRGKTLAAAAYIASMLDDDLLAGLEVEGMTEPFEAPGNQYRKALAEKLLKSRDLWEEVWHNLADGFWDWEHEEREKSWWKKMDEARRALHKHHGTRG